MDQLYPEPSTFGQCDCTSYSYFALSMVLFAVGTVITVLALGDSDGYIFSSLGHMWLVGPIFICSGLMVAVKSVLYLRRKGIIQMLLRRRALLRVGFQLFSLRNFQCLSFNFYINMSVVCLEEINNHVTSLCVICQFGDIQYESVVCTYIRVYICIFWGLGSWSMRTCPSYRFVKPVVHSV